MEIGASGFNEHLDLSDPSPKDTLKLKLKTPTPERIFYIADAFRFGMSLDEVFEYTNIDRWFLIQIEQIVASEEEVKQMGFGGIDAATMRRLKRIGLSDLRLSELLGISQKQLRTKRWDLGVHPVFKRVDTCAAEFETSTAYMYSSYDEECESAPSNRDTVSYTHLTLPTSDLV